MRISWIDLDLPREDRGCGLWSRIDFIGMFARFWWTIVGACLLDDSSRDSREDPCAELARGSTRDALACGSGARRLIRFLARAKGIREGTPFGRSPPPLESAASVPGEEELLVPQRGNVLRCIDVLDPVRAGQENSEQDKLPGEKNR
ncbi:hypothetical protein KM043_012673 [Ampulex compressa]|nr:hypothetical protein KM043_012673 [Ampulex compressa]